MTAYERMLSPSLRSFALCIIQVAGVPSVSVGTANTSRCHGLRKPMTLAPLTPTVYSTCQKLTVQNWTSHTGSYAYEITRNSIMSNYK